jgi:hypothetical protein
MNILRHHKKRNREKPEPEKKRLKCEFWAHQNPFKIAKHIMVAASAPIIATETQKPTNNA